MPTMEEVLIESRTLLASMVAIFYWEYITTFKKGEYRMIYKARNSGSPIVKCAFLVNRYAGLVGFTLNLAYMFSVVPHSICRKIHWIPVALATIMFTSTEIIQAIRVYAIWEKSRPIGLFMGCYVICPCVTYIYVNHANYAVAMPEGVKGCIPGSPPHLVSKVWIASTLCCIYDAMAVALTMFKIGYLQRNERKGVPILTLLLRDGIVYFLVVFAVKFAATINLRYNQNNPTLLIPVAGVMTSTMCSRMLFSLRSSHSKSISSSNPSRSWQAHSPAGSGFRGASESKQAPSMAAGPGQVGPPFTPAFDLELNALGREQSTEPDEKVRGIADDDFCEAR